MTRTRIHNFSISLDGFATGEGQALETPFGHAGHRLHEWMIATAAHILPGPGEQVHQLAAPATDAEDLRDRDDEYGA